MNCPFCDSFKNEKKSAYCGKCGQCFDLPTTERGLEPSIHNAKSSKPPACPVKLEVKFGIPVPNRPCSLYWRLTKLDASPLSADLTYDCATLTFSSDETNLRVALESSLSQTGASTFTALEGSHPIKFLVDVEDQRFSGHLELSVLQSGPINYNLIAPAIQNHGGNIVGDHSTQMTITTGGVTRNAAEYNEVELNVSAARTVVRKRAFKLEDHSPPDSKRLVLLLTSGERSRRIVLFGGTKHLVGRGVDCDLGLLCPRKDDPDEARSQMLSRQHAEIEFSQASVQWKERSQAGSELSSANGTHELLKSSDERSLSQGMKLNPAGVLPLKFKLYPCPENLDTAQYRKFVRTELKKEYLDPLGPYHAVTIKREDSWALEEEYLLLQHSTLIGSREKCSIQVLCSSIRTKHAYLHFFGGNFWLERVNKKAAITVDEQELPLHYLTPLVEDMEIQLGNVLLTVESYSQKRR